MAPAVTAYHMNFEPALFVADAKGTWWRLDSISTPRAQGCAGLAGAGLSGLS